MFISVIFSVFYSRFCFEGFLMLLHCSKIKLHGVDCMITGLSSISCTTAAHVEEVLLFDSLCDGSMVVHDDRPL